MFKIDFGKGKREISIMAGVFYYTVFSPIITYANALDNITTGVTAVKTFFLGVVGAIGVIIFARNASDFGAAIQDRDRNGMVSGLFGMIGGAVMALAGSLLALFGIS